MWREGQSLPLPHCLLLAETQEAGGRKKESVVSLREQKGTPRMVAWKKKRREDESVGFFVAAMRVVLLAQGQESPQRQRRKTANTFVAKDWISCSSALLATVAKGLSLYSCVLSLPLLPERKPFCSLLLLSVWGFSERRKKVVVSHHCWRVQRPHDGSQGTWQEKGEQQLAVVAVVDEQELLFLLFQCHRKINSLQSQRVAAMVVVAVGLALFPLPCLALVLFFGFRPATAAGE